LSARTRKQTIQHRYKNVQFAGKNKRRLDKYTDTGQSNFKKESKPRSKPRTLDRTIE
jgi:hypothetical protein